MTWTEIHNASIDDVENAWAVLEAVADAEQREAKKQRKGTRDR